MGVGLLFVVGVVSYLSDVVYYIDVVVYCLTVRGVNCFAFRSKERVLLRFETLSGAGSLCGSIALTA